MQIKFDTHTHSVATGHGFLTFYENAKYAKEIDLDGFAITDHAPAMVDGAKEPYFKNFSVILRDYLGLKILVGAVTHVFVNDSTRGYAIFIENMLDEANKVK